MSSSMRTRMRLLAEDHEKSFVAGCLYPVLGGVSSCYKVVVGSLRGAYEKKVLSQKRLPFPVVSVGNLTWGGAGKTPVVEYLARKISERRKTPLILTRGYSQDEVEQIKHHLPHVLLGVGKDRIQTAQAIMKDRRVDMALLDDGLQHWKVARDLEIIVINSLNPFGNGKLIPRGILREPITVLKRADIVILTHVNLAKTADLNALRTKVQELAPKAKLVETYLDPLFLYRANRRKRVSITSLKNQRVTTFSGVGTPRSFQLLLARHQIRTARNFEFSDHHTYTEKELNEIRQVSDLAAIEDIITTEKDFYRCQESITRVLNPLVLATRLRILSGEEYLNSDLNRLLGIGGQPHAGA